MSPSQEQRRKAVAYHEAGHAVANLARGYTFERIELEPSSDGRWGGTVIGGKQNDASCAAAGIIAENHLSGDDEHTDDDLLSFLTGVRENFRRETIFHRRMYGPYNSDLYDFYSACAAIEIENWIDIWRACERELTGCLWSAVEGIAEALLSDGNVSFVRAEKMYEEANRTFAL